MKNVIENSEENEINISEEITNKSEQEQELQLKEFITETDDNENSPSEVIKQKVEKITNSVAASMVTGGANGLLTVANLIFSTQIKISALEINALSDDLAPVIVKYGTDLDELPAWVKEIIKYRMELIAIKGICLFGVSIVMQIKEGKRLALIEAKKSSVENKDTEL